MTKLTAVDYAAIRLYRAIPRLDISAYICTESGRKVYLFDHGFDDEALQIEDIANALCKLSRWNGHTTVPVSVAWHSVLVSSLAEIADPKDKSVHRWGLLHDASEAYLGDVVSPLKASLPDYKLVEHFMQLRIAERFKTPIYESVIKVYDEMALAIEHRFFRRGELRLPRPLPHLFNLAPLCLEPTLTPEEFVARFEAVGGVN